MIWRCRLLSVDDVEVDEAERADAGGGEVERERRAEAAGADAEDLGGLELLLAFHADFGQDEVARVARDLFVGELGECGFSASSVGILFPPGGTPSPVLFGQSLQRMDLALDLA